MKRLWIAIAIFLLFLCGAFFVKLYASYVFWNSPKVSLDEGVLWSLVQDWRVDQGLQTYTKDQRLCDLASARLPEIKALFEHDGWKEHIAGMEYVRIAENISRDYSSESNTLDGWLLSPTHKASLDYPYSYSCIKCDGTYCVQEFGNF